MAKDIYLVYVIAIDWCNSSWQRMWNQLLFLWLIMFNLCIVSLYRGCLLMLAVNKSCKNVTAASQAFFVWTQLTSMVSGVGCDDCYDTLPQSQERNSPSQLSIGVHGRRHRSARESSDHQRAEERWTCRCRPCRVSNGQTVWVTALSR